MPLRPSRRSTLEAIRSVRSVGVVCAVALTAFLLYRGAREWQRAKNRYSVSRLDHARYLRQGTDFGNPDYTLAGSARRVGVTPEQLDRKYDYDFFRLAAAEERLAGVDRPTALGRLFESLTAGALNNTEKHLGVLEFLQKASLHNPYLQPTYPDRSMVTDPLVLLELGEMRCGHVARIAVDLFRAGGYAGRLVPLGSHVIAEIQYDGAWHYFDADLFGNGECVRNADGTIPSIEELSREPLRIDALPMAWEPDSSNAPMEAPPCRASYYYFSRDAWEENFAGCDHGPQPPYAIYKWASLAEQRRSREYGWDCVRRELSPRRLSDIPPSHPPGAPGLTSVKTQTLSDGRVRVTLAWGPSPDADGDLLGYRVMVSQRSRGWYYATRGVAGCRSDSRSRQGNWKPGMYEARFTLPRSEVALIETKSPSADFTLPTPGDYYVSVMPYDARGERAGQRLYPMSREICVHAPRP